MMTFDAGLNLTIRISTGLLVLGFSSGACHRTAPVERKAEVDRVAKDTAGVVAVFDEPARTSASVSKARTFKLREPGQRDSLRATVGRERDQWRATNLRDYQFLLRVECFCPGRKGWLLMEVRSGRLIRASDSTGKSVAFNENTLTIEGLFDNLEQKVDIDGVVDVAFDPRWHFPAHVSTIRLPGPDNWSIVEARGIRRIP